jgi:hypothetical protein
VEVRKVRDREYIPVLRTLLGSSNSAGFMLPAAKLTVLTGKRAPQISGERDESFPSYFCSLSILDGATRI